MKTGTKLNTLYDVKQRYHNTLAYGFVIAFFTVFLNSVFSSVKELCTSRLFHTIAHL